MYLLNWKLLQHLKQTEHNPVQKRKKLQCYGTILQAPSTKINTLLVLYVKPEEDRRPSINNSNSLQGQVSASQDSLGTSFNSSSKNRNAIIRTFDRGRYYRLGASCAHNRAWKMVQRIRLALKHTPLYRHPSTSMKQATAKLCLHSQVRQFAGRQELQRTAQTKWTVHAKPFSHDNNKRKIHSGHTFGSPSGLLKKPIATIYIFSFIKHKEEE